MITDDGTGLPSTNEEPAITPNFITIWGLITIVRIGSSSMCIDADLQQTHGKSTGFLPICLNQSCRKSTWTMQKGEGCFWTWKAPTESYVPKSPLPCPPQKKTFSPWSIFQMGNNNRSQHFLSNCSVQTQSHVPFSDSILFLHQPYTVSVFIISIFREAIMAHRGKVPCLLTPSCIISQTGSKIVITTH